ncbi:ribonuclease HII [Kineococcus glutinatus]|uniref:ribonuclease HII n=1 Tax=Kineococcus glutinatus TaxID=1070872 RepID=UPI003CD0BB78
MPTLRAERELLRGGHQLVAGVDEVGRGALAGPVSVGVVCVQARTRSAPTGLRDSKLLTPAAREALVAPLQRWAVAWAVGHAEAHEVDAVGIVAALRLAGRRALAQLPQQPGAVLLDGSHDWLSPPAQPLLLGDGDGDGGGDGDPSGGSCPVVVTRVKADLSCAAVAAASVLAKTTRDALMREHHLADPRYGWDVNKGYSAPAHLSALAAHGPCAQHRLSWRLPAPRTEAGGPRAEAVRGRAGRRA